MATTTKATPRVLSCPLTGTKYYFVTKTNDRSNFLAWAYKILNLQIKNEKEKVNLLMLFISPTGGFTQKSLRFLFIAETNFEISSTDFPFCIENGFIIESPMSPHIKRDLDLILNSQNVSLIGFDLTNLVASITSSDLTLNFDNIMDLQCYEAPPKVIYYFQAYRCRSLVDYVSNFISDYNFEGLKKIIPIINIKEESIEQIRYERYIENPEGLLQYISSDAYIESKLIRIVYIALRYYDLKRTEDGLDKVKSNSHDKYTIYQQIVEKYKNRLAPALQKNWCYLPKALRVQPDQVSEQLEDLEAAYRTIAKVTNILDNYDLYKEIFGSNAIDKEVLNDYLNCTWEYILNNSK